jgi:hypothetical protein
MLHYRLMGATLKLELPAWINVLRLADMWALDSLRATAVAQLDAQLRVNRAEERLRLANKFKIQDWIIPAMRQLITRQPPFNAAVIGLFRPEMLAIVLALRETNLYKATRLISNADGFTQYPLNSEVDKEIQLEFGAGVEL